MVGVTPGKTSLPPPLVRAAAICERVLLEKDETLSLIRLVDQFTLTAEPTPGAADAPPERMPSASFGISLVLSTVAGEARGERLIAIAIVKPDGSRTGGPEWHVTYDSETASRNWIVKLNLNVAEPGVYWIEWTCNGQLLTRVPLQIRYERRSKTDGSRLKTGESVH